MVGFAFRCIFLFGIVAFGCIYALKMIAPPGSAGLFAPPGVGGAAPAPARASAPTTSSLVYSADRMGHVRLEGEVNGGSVRFLVDTGATLVALTPEDARSAGIGRAQLSFNQQIQTANGVTRVAPVMLREIRIASLTLYDVPAVVVENLSGNSLLGQSFLKRLQSYEMRDNRLTLNW